MLESVGLPVMAYDGIAEFHAETVEEVLEMFGSKEYQEVGNLSPRLQSAEADLNDRK
jgi:hypothetical protein